MLWAVVLGLLSTILHIVPQKVINPLKPSMYCKTKFVAWPYSYQTGCSWVKVSDIWFPKQTAVLVCSDKKWSKRFSHVSLHYKINAKTQKDTMCIYSRRIAICNWMNDINMWISRGWSHIRKCSGQRGTGFNSPPVGKKKKEKGNKWVKLRSWAPVNSLTLAQL